MDGISIVIPSAGRSRTINLLLQSIERQRCDLPLEVLLLPNGVKEDSQWQSDQFTVLNQLKCDLRLERIEERGVNYSRNLGLKLAKYDLVFFVDDDCELDDDLILQKHYRLHQQNKAVFAVGGLYEISSKASFFTKVYQLIQMNWLYRGLIQSGPQCEYLIGGHFSVKKDLARLNEINFNNSIVYGGSELSFFKKARMVDLELQLHELSVFHHTKESFWSLHRKIFKQGQGQALVPGEHVEIKNSVRRTDSFFTAYFSILFWLGFFYQKKNLLGFANYLFQSTKNYFLFRKYKILDSVNSIIDSKKRRGDRL